MYRRLLSHPTPSNANKAFHTSGVNEYVPTLAGGLRPLRCSTGTTSS
jgi:hypothetical protein